MKQKILIFNGYYTPAKKYGGPLTSIRNVIKTCSGKYDFYIISYNHDVGSKDIFKNILAGWNDVDNAKVLYVSDKEIDFSRKQINQIIEAVRPDLIWFSGILRPHIRLLTLSICKQKNIPILISPRGEVSRDRIAIKGYKKKPYIFLTKILGFYKKAWFHATSDDEVEGLQKYVGAKEGQIFKIANIGAIPEKYRKNYIKEANTLKIVFISRIHMVKNLKLAVTAVSKMKGNVIFDIYGPMEMPEYWEECKKIAAQAPETVKIVYRGQIDPNLVGGVFAKYDCFLFPTINENYGHAIAEALANGCPVVLSRGTTPWDCIDKKAGFLCSIDNENEIIHALSKIQTLGKQEYEELSRSATNLYKMVFEKAGAVVQHQKMFDYIINKISY